MTPKAQQFISRKIRYMVKRERRSLKQAIAIAFSLARKRGFKVRKNPKRRR